MRIGFDGTPLTTPFHCGTKNYAVSLINAISQIDNINEYFIYVSKKVSIPRKKNFHLIILPNFPILKKQFFLPIYVSKYNVDIFHNLEPFGSIFLNHSRMISTVHDLNLNWTYPYKSKYLVNRVYCELMRSMVLRKTRVFITDTNFIKNELQNFNKRSITKKRIHVIPLSHHVFSQKYTVKVDKQPYFLCMGDFTKRKNLNAIFVAYSRLPTDIKTRFNLKVVISTKSIAKKYTNTINKYFKFGNIQIVTAPTDNKLGNLYRHATCFLYTSLYEGFGIPILEAMACGCPVITSNLGSMKEVAGDAALLVNPHSSDQIKKAIEKIVNTPRFAHDLSNKGIKRSNDFSWPKVAKETLALYHSVFKMY